MSKSEDEVDPVLAKARGSFSFFYDAAGEDDVMAMDLLVLASQSLVLNIDFPRRPLPPQLRARIERLGHHIELNFIDARRRVSECQTFQNLDCSRQQQVADALFSPFGA